MSSGGADGIVTDFVFSNDHGRKQAQRGPDDDFNLANETARFSRGRLYSTKAGVTSGAARGR